MSDRKGHEISLREPATGNEPVVIRFAGLKNRDY